MGGRCQEEARPGLTCDFGSLYETSFINNASAFSHWSECPATNEYSPHRM